MPRQVTKEVIDNVLVVRYNGNNSPGSREGSGESSRQADHAARLTAWQKAKARKRVKEKAYARRYLGG